MPSGTADFHAALQAAWDGSGLNDSFQALWPVDVDKTAFPVLHDQEATPDQPFPYCVFETAKPTIATRMTNTINDKAGTKRNFREYPITFNIHAKPIQGNPLSPKQIAAGLSDAVLQVFGGHSSIAPKAEWEMTNGGVLQVRYISDYPVRTELYHYMWVIQYSFLLDVPVAIA